MAEKVLMLALSPTMETGTIANWLVKEGDEIANGQVICEVETDKATMDYESIQEGTLLKILVPEGKEARVAQSIAIIGKTGEDIGDLIAEAAESPPEEKPQAAVDAPLAEQGSNCSAAP